MPSTKFAPYEGVVAVPALHWGQRQVLAERRTYNYLCAHRGWRKSSLLLRIALEHVFQGGDLGWYALTWKPLQENLRMLQHALGHDEWFNKTEATLKIPGGGCMFFYSLELPNNARGPSHTLVLLEEAGVLEDRVREEVLYPVFRKANGVIWEIGTPNPYNPFNDFYRLLHQARDHPSHMASWVIPVCGMVYQDGELVPKAHPLSDYANWDDWPIEKAELDWQLAVHKDSWRIEYLCEFISHDDTRQFANVESVCVLTPQNQEPEPGHMYQTGVDIGIRNDYTVVATIDTETRRQVYYRRFLPGRWEPVYQELERVAATYPGPVYVDTTKDTHVVEEMRQRGVTLRGVGFNQHNKEAMLNHLASLIENGCVKLFNDPILKQELTLMERTARDTGGFQIRAPRGGHDDIPIALALMCYQVFPQKKNPLLRTDYPPAGITQLRSPFSTIEQNDLKTW